MQKDANNDQELIFKKRARRRLVGAVALVLLMIVVLPMILKDRSLVQPKEEITITLPNENMQVDSKSDSKTNKITEEKLPDDFDSNIVDAEQVAVETLKSNGESQASLKQNNVETETVNDSPAVSETQATTKKDTVKKTAAIKKELELKPQAPGHFYVQVGVFSEATNVKLLQAKLSDIGYKSQTEKINTDKGQKIRLRTQSFDSRTNAANALENIKKAGLTGMVVSKSSA